MTSVGDAAALMVLLLLTLGIAGRHLAGLSGVLVGVVVGLFITRVRFRTR